MPSDHILRIQLLRCELNQDLDYFSKNDPYVEMECGNQKWKSKVIQDGGRNVEWDQDQYFDLKVQSG